MTSSNTEMGWIVKIRPPGVCQKKFSMGVSTADLSQTAMAQENSLSYNNFLSVAAPEQITSLALKRHIQQQSK